MGEVITIENVRSRMVMLRGEATLLDRDVAALYQIDTTLRTLAGQPSEATQPKAAGMTVGAKAGILV